MRKAVLAAQMLTLSLAAVALAFAQGKITVDPNAPGSRPADQADSSALVKDPRLDQKITYRVKLREIADMTADLTEITGVTFSAGSSKSDWRVREDCTTIIAKDTTLSSLMNSIAHVMKYRWSRHGTAPNWTYRLVEDRAAIASAKHRLEAQNKRNAEKRQKCWDELMAVNGMSPDELAKLKESNPLLYLCSKAGVLGPVAEFLQAAPMVKDAWLADEGLKLRVAWLPSSAQQALDKAARAGLDLEARLHVGGSGMADWYSSQLAELDRISGQMTVEVWKSEPYSRLPRLQVTGPGEIMSIMFEDIRSESERLTCKGLLRAYEEKRSFHEVREEMRDQIRAAEKKESPEPWIASYTQEPILDHPDDPALSVPLKDKVAEKTLTGTIASLADVTGFAIVTDDYRGRTSLALEKGTKLLKVFKIISRERSPHNWNRSGQVIELWDANWYDNREARVSKAWLDELRRKFKENGTLDIDDLAQIAALTDGQLGRNISRDEVLRSVSAAVWDKRDYLKIYAALSSPQRSLLLSDAGIAYPDLSPDQQRSMMKLVLGQSVPFLESPDLAGLGVRVSCAKESEGKRFIYTFKAYTSLGQIPGQYRFRTPVYVEPPKPPDKETPKSQPPAASPAPSAK